MLHLDLNLNPQIEQQFLFTVRKKFQGSFEAFIQASLEKQQPEKLNGKLSDFLLAPELDMADSWFERSRDTGRDIEL